MKTIIAELSARRQELIRRVQEIVAKKRENGAVNGQLAGHNDLLVALGNPRRRADYCPKCLVLVNCLVACNREIKPMLTCGSAIFSIQVGE
jgi:hypothetical protein